MMKFLRGNSDCFPSGERKGAIYINVTDHINEEDLSGDVEFYFDPEEMFNDEMEAFGMNSERAVFWADKLDRISKALRDYAIEVSGAA